MKTVVLYEVGTGDELPKEFAIKNIVNTFTELNENKEPRLWIWCIEEQKGVK